MNLILYVLCVKRSWEFSGNWLFLLYFVSGLELKSNWIFFSCRKRAYEYEEIIVTPIHPPSDIQPSQLTEDNEDFAGRLRFHQTANVQPLMGSQGVTAETVQILQ